MNGKIIKYIPDVAKIKLQRRMRSYLYLLLLFVLFVPVKIYPQDTAVNKIKNAPSPQEKENLKVFQQWTTWNNPGSLLINHLTREAQNYYQIRDEEIKRLRTKDDWQKRQQVVKKKLKELLGSFPKKEALNAMVTGVIEKGDYRIEKIIYESSPGAYVTGCLYVPSKINDKAPAILNLIGHDQEAFRAELYQVINTNLAKKGMIVFAIDPPGQGEHVQYYDTTVNFSSIGYTVIEHCYFGNQCFLSGVTAAKHFIWEGMRAIDYLLTRKEVDPQNIGVTGFSGGGTITSYISAVDDRVKVSVPSSWAAASKRHIETKAGFDSECVFIDGVKEGITFEDLLEVRAPKPTLMTFASRDQYLSVQGARDAYEEAKRCYEAFGKRENLGLIEDDSKHWMTPKIRLAIYTFFLKHFNITGDPTEEKVEMLPEKELHVTSTGQIATDKGGRMIFDLNRIESEKLLKNLDQSRKNITNHLSKVKTRASDLSGYISPSGDKPEPFSNGRYQRNGYTVELLAIPGEKGNYAIPILLFKPDDNLQNHSAVIYLNAKGKETDAAPGGAIEKLVKRGYIVAAVDVLGIGETSNTAGRGASAGYLGILIGRSIVGIQAADIVRAANYLKDRDDIDPSKIRAIGMDEMCVPVIHAAAFDSSIQNIALIRPLISYSAVVMNRFYKIGLTKHEGGGIEHPYEVDFSWGVAGALTGYDLPDLIGCIAPRQITIVSPTDQVLEPASQITLRKELEFPRSAYALKNATNKIKVFSSFENLYSLIE